MRLTRRSYLTRNEKVIDFVLGFVGFLILNGLLWMLVQFGVAAMAVMAGALDGGGSGVPNNVLWPMGVAATCLPLTLNIALVILFARTRYWVALGAAAAFAVGLVVAACLALFAAAAWFTVRGAP